MPDETTIHMADPVYPITSRCVVGVFVVLLRVTRSLTDTECTAGYYLDTVTGQCDSCSDICTFTHIQRTRDLCQQKCPGWPPHQPIPAQPVSAAPASSASSASKATSNVTPFPKREIPTPIVIMMCVGVSVAVLVAIVTCCNKRIHKAIQNVKLSRQCKKRGVQAHADVQETPGLLRTQSEPTAPPMEDIQIA